MKTVIAVLSTLAMVVMLALPAAAIDIPSEVTLFKNVNIFDGKNEKLLEGYDVLVVKNLIKKIDKNIKLASTYEIDVKTGGLKARPGGYLSDITPQGENNMRKKRQLVKNKSVRLIIGFPAD